MAGFAVNAVHVHTMAPPQIWPWLPTLGSRLVARHPFCRECGTVKALGTSPSKSLGTLLNLLGRLEQRIGRDGFKITQTQKRLITKLLVSKLTDPFGLLAAEHRDAFLDAVTQITGFNSDYLDDCLRFT